jgi:hypothetical protein
MFKCKLLHLGDGWGALLVAGNDTDNGNNARAFKDDMEKFKRIIVSRTPLVMGIRYAIMYFNLYVVTSYSSDIRIQTDFRFLLLVFAV